MKKDKTDEAISLTQAVKVIARDNNTFRKELCKKCDRSNFSFQRACKSEALTVKSFSKYLNAAGEQMQIILKSGKILTIKFKD